MKNKQLLIIFVGVVAALTFGSVISAQHFGEWGAPVSVESIPGTSSEFNTAFNDGCPIQAPDGLSFFMASNRPGGLGGLDIWIARRANKNDPWGTPENAGASVNSTADDFCPTPVRGKGLYFVSARTQPGSCGGPDIYFTREKRGVYQEPQNLGCDINSSAAEWSPSYFEGENGREYLYFSSTRPGGFDNDTGLIGDMDIYVSTDFGMPQIAPGLNTEFDDSRPNVRKDGREIVFDSTRPGTLGATDIWTASRENIADDWTSLVHFNAPINSPAGESRASLSWDGLQMVFGSNRPGGEGSADIYVATREKLRGNE